VGRTKKQTYTTFEATNSTQLEGEDQGSHRVPTQGLPREGAELSEPKATYPQVVEVDRQAAPMLVLGEALARVGTHREVQTELKFEPCPRRD